MIAIDTSDPTAVRNVRPPRRHPHREPERGGGQAAVYEIIPDGPYLVVEAAGPSRPSA